jgi:hypothetical protein
LGVTREKSCGSPHRTSPGQNISQADVANPRQWLAYGAEELSNAQDPWQVVPGVMPKFLADPGREKAARATNAMMNMVKLDIAAPRDAHEGRS